MSSLILDTYTTRHSEPLTINSSYREQITGHTTSSAFSLESLGSNGTGKHKNRAANPMRPYCLLLGLNLVIILISQLLI